MTTDVSLEQAVRDAATAAGVRPDRVQLVSQLLPPTVLTRTADNRIDPHAVEVGVRGVLHLVPEWVAPTVDAPASATSGGNGGAGSTASSDTTDLLRLMQESVGITAPGAAR